MRSERGRQRAPGGLCVAYATATRPTSGAAANSIATTSTARGAATFKLDDVTAAITVATWSQRTSVEPMEGPSGIAAEASDAALEWWCASWWSAGPASGAHAHSQASITVGSAPKASTRQRATGRMNTGIEYTSGFQPPTRRRPHRSLGTGKATGIVAPGSRLVLLNRWRLGSCNSVPRAHTDDKTQLAGVLAVQTC